jgi:hypothetical protein
MFRCDNCQKEKPENERTRIPGWMSWLIGYAGMVHIGEVCRNCAQRTRRLGYFTLAGFGLILLILAGAALKVF